MSETSQDTALIPWQVAEKHRGHEIAELLQLESLSRAHAKISEDETSRLAKWHGYLDDQQVVVNYNPTTPYGFYYTPRAKSDDDIIRKP